MVRAGRSPFLYCRQSEGLFDVVMSLFRGHVHVLLGDSCCGVAHELGDDLDRRACFCQASAVGMARGMEVDPFWKACLLAEPVEGVSQP